MATITKDKIGISIAINTGKDNWDRMVDLVNEGFKHIEFYNKLIRIRTADVPSIISIATERGLTFSFHSMVQDLFCEDPDIANQEYYTLRGEIKLAKMIGCKRVIFHIHKKTELGDKEIASLNQLADFANSLGITLAQENNSSGVMSGLYLVQLAERVSNLRFCIDIGHLNVAINKGMFSEKDTLLRKLSSKIVEFHISSNNGQKDEHKALEVTNVDYLKEILSQIDNENIDYIIETKNLEQAKVTYDTLTMRLYE